MPRPKEQTTRSSRKVDLRGISRDDVQAEISRRRKARSSLLYYSQAINVPGVPIGEHPEDIEDPTTGKLVNRFEDPNKPPRYQAIETPQPLHMRIMLNAIQECIETPRGRLIIMAPPGCAKSTAVSVVGASWAMGRKANTQVILGSYATGIAAKQSRKVRTIVKGNDYRTIWEDEDGFMPSLTDDQRAVDDWSLSNGSSMLAAGFLAGITGNRCDLFIADDPVANREQADSATIREKIYNEYTDTAMTRAKPWMSAILVMTRWQEDDLVGAILPAQYEGESGLIKCRDGQTWNVLCFQAECERNDDILGRKKGEFIWGEWFPKDHWSTWRDNPRAARTWSALFQQRPAPWGGVHFNRDMFKFYDPSLPKDYTA